MRRSVSIFLAGLATISIAACNRPAPPATPPTIASTPPALDDGPFATHIVTARFPGTVAETRAYLDTDSRLLYAMEDTGDIARPVGFKMLSGDTWPAPDAVRRLEFSDGHYSMERAIEVSPERFTYQVWDFTSATGKNVEYIYGVQELSPNPDGGTDFLWTYNVRPNAGWKRPFVQRFVDSDVSVLLDTATSKIESEANGTTD